MIYNRDFILKTTLANISKKIDKGDIVIQSRKKNIKKLSIVYSYLYSWLLNSEILFKINKNQRYLKKTIKIKKTVSNKTNYNFNFFKKVSLIHKKGMTLSDIILLIKLCFTRGRISTYLK